MSRGASSRALRRAGFSLVEMVIVLVLAGIVSTAAISMFSTQNRLNAAMTALGESQENARSALQIVSSDLRALSSGSVVTARSDGLVINVPTTMGIVCGEGNGGRWGVFFPLDGEVLDLDELGIAARDSLGAWTFSEIRRNTIQFQGNGSRQLCVDEETGAGVIGADSDYATMRLPGSQGQGGPGLSVGSAIMLYRQVEYRFAESTLDTTQRAFMRGEPGTTLVELAQGFADTARFEYRYAGEATWRSNVTVNNVEHIGAIRVVADVRGQGTSGAASHDANFSLMREIPLGGSP